MSEAHCDNIAQRKALGLVTHDNTGGPFVVECQGCGAVYPSFHCLGGGQIADTGDYDDARCPHCDQIDPQECDNAGLAWNTQQLKINALQELLNQRDEQIHNLEQRRYAEQRACQAAERRVQELKGLLAEAIKGWELIQYGDPPVKLSKVMAHAKAALNPTTEEEIPGSACNQVREKNNLPTKNPCVACNGGACIDR